MSSREIEDWETSPSDEAPRGNSAAERFIDFMESDEHQPEDPRRREWARDLIIRMEEQEREMQRQMAELEQRSKLGRFMTLRANPQLREYIEYRKAQDSIVEARRSAERNEGKSIII